MPITITVTLETPGELDAWAEKIKALGQIFDLVEERPQPAAARKPRETKPAGIVPADASAGISPVSALAGPMADTTTTLSSGPTATTAASPSDAVVVTDADITAAANAAAAALGAAGPAKIKAHIAANFTKPDGTPGTLKTTRPEQQAALLADLQKIARKELML